MNNVWAPWRIEYILSHHDDGCFLCEMFGKADDRGNRLLKRGETCAVVMNRFPYTGGHLMVAPLRHVGGLSDVSGAEMAEMMSLAQRCVSILEREMKAQGFNIGFNLGKAAGAGLKDHIHLHVVPRWIGDTNFMPILSHTTVIPQALDDLYDRLLPAFAT